MAIKVAVIEAAVLVALQRANIEHRPVEDRDIRQACQMLITIAAADETDDD